LTAVGLKVEPPHGWKKPFLGSSGGCEQGKPEAALLGLNLFIATTAGGVNSNENGSAGWVVTDAEFGCEMKPLQV
jgi:hypothetical protein